MPDRESSSPAHAADCGNPYLNGATAATHSLARSLAARIEADGPLPFRDFMATALYDPHGGYYARGGANIGREGDFFTSVSVGPVFGALLARRFLHAWLSSGRPRRWRVMECGAHDGRLAGDVLSALLALDPQAYGSVEYLIAEPLPSLRELQSRTLAPHAGQVAWADLPGEGSGGPLPGVVFGNELLDALPFDRVEWRDGQWWECRVAVAPGGSFGWTLMPVKTPGLADALAPLAGPFPDGYRTEVRTGFQPFIADILRWFDRPLMLWFDYGFARADYYDPARTAGTLRTFSRHRAGEDPLVLPGTCDITAHVDFTAVAEAARALGGVVVDFRSQGSWLTHWGREWLLALEGHLDARSALRQFQTLTHPAHLGSRFQVIELSWCPQASPMTDCPLG